MQAPVDQISNTVKKAKFVKEIIKNSTKDTLSTQKVTQIARDIGWGNRPQDALKDAEVQVILKPITDQLIQIRQDVVTALQNKDFTNERTTDLTDIMDKLTKNIQLLTGGETEKHKVVFGWENPGGEQLENISNTNVQIDNNSLLSPPLGNEPAQFTTALEGVCTSP